MKRTEAFVTGLMSNKIAKEEFSREAINGKIRELEIFLNENLARTNRIFQKGSR